MVSGASSGLGRVLAELLCEKGYLVYVTARRRNMLESLKKQCEKLPGEIIPIPGDISIAEFRNKLVGQILKKEGKIDFLFNNAGFARAVMLEDESAEDIQKMFEVNVIAYQHLSSLVLKSMKAKNKGRIINIGSVVAFTPLPYFTTYNSTKAAVYSFNRALRYELKGTKVTSTVVLPARMNTGFADNAYTCYKEKGRDVCVREFNKMAGSPYIVARKIIKRMDSGNEVILPNLLSFIWYTMRYFAFAIDFAMKNFLGPKELARIERRK